MSSSDIAVSVRGVGKSYTIAHQTGEKQNTLAEAMLDRLRHPFRRSTKETFWALNDVSFDIGAGEVVGIVGRNGAGKSTLLKLLSQITEPTTGEIDLDGRVGSLLEVGTGFHGELTGRENIFLNGAILGMSRSEIKKQFDAIVDFAGVEQFLDTPVKRYSSGMYVRLAFAVAAHLQSEILIVDEVLAVGDSEFQKKCLNKMGSVAAGGRTVLFVSHSMSTLAALCNRSILLQSGGLLRDGPSSEVIKEYLQLGVHQPLRIDLRPSNRSGALGRSGRIASVSIENSGHGGNWLIEFGEPLLLNIEIDALQYLKDVELGVSIHNSTGQELTSNLSSRYADRISYETGTHEITVKLGPTLFVPGFYRLSIGLRSGQGMEDLLSDVAEFEIMPNQQSLCLNTQSMNALFIADAQFAFK